MKKEISTEKAPQAIGPYSQAIVTSGQKLLFVSGQLPISPENGDIVAATIKDQTAQVLENVKGVVQAAGGTLSQVIKTTVYLKNMEDFAGMNAVYADYFEKPFPARAAVEVARLPKDVLVEIECIAVMS